MDWKKTHALNDLKESIVGLNLIVIGNLILVGFFLSADANYLWTNSHVTASLLTALIFLLFRLFYDGKTQALNFALLTVYLVIFVLECIIVGMPGSPIAFRMDYNKGLMLDGALSLIPALYVGMRLCLGFPLLLIINKQKKAAPYIQ